MTDRIIRLEDGIREIYLSYEDGFSVSIDSKDFDETPFIEPAPPKDWKPYCFSDFDKDGKCDHDEYYMMASCDKCPFTK